MLGSGGKEYDRRESPKEDVGIEKGPYKVGDDTTPDVTSSSVSSHQIR